jgi:acyl carrier protein
MTEPNTEDKLFAILSSLLKTIQQWDSLKHMHLVMALEEEFGIEFDDGEVSNLASAAALLDSINGKLAT